MTTTSAGQSFDEMEQVLRQTLTQAQELGC